MMVVLNTLIELLEILELRRETAFAGSVHDQNDFALQVHERILVPFFIFRLEIVERCC